MSEEISAEVLCKLALEAAGGSLEVRMLASLDKGRDIGIFRREGHHYFYELSWVEAGKEHDFLLEVFEVLPSRKDRNAKVERRASRQFTEKFDV
jgi:hypothetical protein